MTPSPPPIAAETQTDPLVRVERLTTTIETPRGVVRPLDDISLTIGRGETLGVVGETGSGKSILIKSIMGLLPAGGSIDESSRVVFDGTDLTRLSPKQLRGYWGRDIALVPQDPGTSLNPVRRIGDQLADSMRHHMGMSRRDALTRSCELLDQVGIASARSRLKLYPHELSGGMRQRVLIAMAISLSPRLLVADEPTTALDVTIQSQILDLIDALKEDIGMSVVLVSHDLSLVAGRADRVAVMYGGKIVEELPSEHLHRSHAHPYTVGLLRSHPDIDAVIDGDLFTIPGEPPDILRRPIGCPFAPRCGSATEVCVDRMPEVVEAGPGHRVACHHPVGSTRPSGTAQPLTVEARA